MFICFLAQNYISQGKKTVFESVGAAANAPVPPARGQ